MENKGESSSACNTPPSDTCNIAFFPSQAGKPSTGAGPTPFVTISARHLASVTMSQVDSTPCFMVAFHDGQGAPSSARVNLSFSVQYEQGRNGACPSDWEMPIAHPPQIEDSPSSTSTSLPFKKRYSNGSVDLSDLPVFDISPPADALSTNEVANYGDIASSSSPPTSGSTRSSVDTMYSACSEFNESNADESVFDMNRQPAGAVVGMEVEVEMSPPDQLLNVSQQSPGTDSGMETEAEAPPPSTVPASEFSTAGNQYQQSQTVSDQAGDQVTACPDYYMHLSIDAYFERCKKLRIRHFNNASRDCILRLTEEYDKSQNPDNGILSDLMARTFRLRNYDIRFTGLSVVNAVNIYPGLRNYSQLQKEFERITKKSVQDFEENLNRVMKLYATKQTSLVTGCSDSSLCNSSIELIRHRHTARSSSTRRADARTYIYGCGQTDGEWDGSIFKIVDGDDSDDFDMRLHPFIVIKGHPFNTGSADVYCENVKICEKLNFYEAIRACYYVYYVFNLEYTVIDKKIFEPFDRVLKSSDSI